MSPTSLASSAFPITRSTLLKDSRILSCLYFAVMARKRIAAHRRVGRGGECQPMDPLPMLPPTSALPALATSLLPTSIGPVCTGTGAPVEAMPIASAPANPQPDRRSVAIPALLAPG
jgi:hypothetical protein